MTVRARVRLRLRLRLRPTVRLRVRLRLRLRVSFPDPTWSHKRCPASYSLKPRSMFNPQKGGDMRVPL